MTPTAASRCSPCSRPRARRSSVDIANIPGAADPELAVNDVAAGGGTQVAVGSANGYPAAWTSANGGITWTRANGQTQAVLDRPGVQQLTSVTFGADGWLAVGGVIAVATPHPVVLTSGNGSVWTAADAEAAFSQPGLVTEQAAAAPGTGYVIVGYQAVAGRTIAAAWYSAGLTGWQRAGDAVSANGGPGALDGPGSRQMRAVTAGPRGFVAVGADGNAAAAWTSPNGQAWTQQNVPLPVGATRAVLQHVASNGHTVVAVGTATTTAGQQLPFAASSADGGATWTESALPVPQGRAFVTALDRDGRAAEFLATGTFGSTPGHQDVVVWTSASGSAWQAVTPAGQGLTGAGIQAITGLDVFGPHADRRRLHRHARRRAARLLAVTGPLIRRAANQRRADRTRPPAGWPGSAPRPGPSRSARRRPRPPPLPPKVPDPAGPRPAGRPACCARPRSRPGSPARIGSGTCPTAATHTVFSMARARTRVTQCSSLTGPAAHAAGSTSNCAPATASARDSSPNRTS